MAFQLSQGHYRLQFSMSGPNPSNFNIAILIDDGADGGYTGNAASDFISNQTDHDTLVNLTQGLIDGCLANNSTRWTSGTVTAVYKTPTSVVSV